VLQGGSGQARTGARPGPAPVRQAACHRRARRAARGGAGDVAEGPRMTMPTGIGVVDTMIGVPVPPADVSVYEFLKPLYMDRESKEEFDFPVEYMFKDVPRPKSTSTTRWGCWSG